MSCGKSCLQWLSADEKGPRERARENVQSIAFNVAYVFSLSELPFLLLPVSHFWSDLILATALSRTSFTISAASLTSWISPIDAPTQGPPHPPPPATAPAAPQTACLDGTRQTIC